MRKQIKVSIIIPCFLRNKEDNRMLNRLLESVRAQTMKINQTIVIDDASSFHPMCNFEEIDHIRLNMNSGPAKARNTGINLALENENSYILFTDHDCILHESWASEMVKFMNKTSLDATGGLTQAAGSTIIDRFHNVNGTLNGRLILPEKKYLLYVPTCNFGISHKVAREFKFDEIYRRAAGEDVDYCLRIRKKYPIGFCSKAVVYHDFGYKNSVSGLLRLIRTFKKYKEANDLLYQSHPDYFRSSWFESEPVDMRHFR